MVLWFWLAVASASPPDPDVVSGADLADWAKLPHGTTELADAYARFLLVHPNSALAELAWARLHGLQAHAQIASISVAAPDLVVLLERSWAAHREVLDRGTDLVVVQPLSPSGEPLGRSRTRFNPTLHVAGGVGREGFEGAAGAGLRWGPAGVVLRAVGGQHARGEIAVRLAPPTWGPVIELGTDSLAQPAVRVGVRAPLQPRAALEIGVGPRLQADGWFPVVRAELVQRAY